MEKWIKRSAVQGTLGELPAWLADLLLARGVDDRQKAHAFLHPDIAQLRDPFRLDGMREAVGEIALARRQGVRVVVYGDYDVDGVCACAILCEGLRAYGVEAAAYIPDRHQEGYGLNETAVRALAERAGLMITVDCGITSVAEVALAKALGMRVIVTDHHTPPQILPDADAVVNPLLGDYPFPSLCGAGVAYKLCTALLGEKATLPMLDLAALATVADMVPLMDENRVIVKLGLERMGQTKRAGLKALLDCAQLKTPLCAQDVAFGLAPRLNAGGRLESALISLTLLQTSDADEARQLAMMLEGLNASRRALQAKVEEEALQKLKGMDLYESAAIVIMGTGYESGVVGLAAGRIAERYGYPTVILSEHEGVAVGSARSAAGVDLYAALSTCSDLFIRFGGHKQAAGMTLKAENVPALSGRLSEAVRAQLNGRAPMREIMYDAELSLSDVNEETYERLMLLEPCGMGNPPPVFLLKNVAPLNVRAVGATGAHLKLMLSDGQVTRGGVAFQKGELAGRLGDKVDALFSLSKNVFNGRTSFECRVTAFAQQPRALGGEKKCEQRAVLQDFCELKQNYTNFHVSDILEAELDALMARPQGVLLCCRTLETAQRMAARYPEAMFAMHALRDVRAYNAVMYAYTLDALSAPYRAVVMCDGLLMAGEGERISRAFPKAKLFSLPRTRALEALIASIAPSRDTLRAMYAYLRHNADAPLYAMCEALAITQSMACAGLFILDELALVAYCPAPYRVTLLPLRKCDPKQSALYMSLNGKEAF